MQGSGYLTSGEGVASFEKRMSSELPSSLGAEPCGEPGIVSADMCLKGQRTTRTHCRAASQNELRRAFLVTAQQATLSLKEVKLVRDTIAHGHMHRHIET